MLAVLRSNPKTAGTKGPVYTSPAGINAPSEYHKLAWPSALPEENTFPRAGKVRSPKEADATPREQKDSDLRAGKLNFNSSNTGSQSSDIMLTSCKKRA